MIDKNKQIVFAFICVYFEKRGIAPSVREISKQCLISIGTAHRCLERLQYAGYITREDSRARSIRILREDACAKCPTAYRDHFVIEMPENPFD
jgi:DNA-binding MarR family transcriptional regulator